MWVSVDSFFCIWSEGWAVVGIPDLARVDYYIVSKQNEYDAKQEFYIRMQIQG